MIDSLSEATSFTLLVFGAARAAISLLSKGR